jgi:hypothetical protein
MFVPSSQIQAAEPRRRDLVTQGLHEQWVAHQLGPTGMHRRHRPLTWPALPLPGRSVLRTARYLLANLAAVAFGIFLN